MTTHVPSRIIESTKQNKGVTNHEFERSVPLSEQASVYDG